MIQAIETRYNGYRFRSRLEARWAIFLDTLNIGYRYEHEGFDIDNTWYLPDFWLPRFDLWIEIKPTLDDIAGMGKAVALSQQINGPVVILIGSPWPGEYIAAHCRKGENGGVRCIPDCQWSECSQCGSLGLASRETPNFICLSGCSERTPTTIPSQ